MEHVLVTGGAGFIGSHFVKRIIHAPDVATVTVLDALTYAGHIENLGTAFLSKKLTFVQGNILDTELVDGLVRECTAVVHFAAESHVDRSFFEAGAFLATNVHGTQILLDAALRHGVERGLHRRLDPRGDRLRPIAGQASRVHPPDRRPGSLHERHSLSVRDYVEGIR